MGWEKNEPTDLPQYHRLAQPNIEKNREKERKKQEKEFPIDRYIYLLSVCIILSDESIIDTEISIKLEEGRGLIYTYKLLDMNFHGVSLKNASGLSEITNLTVYWSNRINFN